MENYDFFSKLANKSRFSVDEKVVIKEHADKHGIAINSRCSSCWKDAVVQLALIYKPKEEMRIVSGYVLRDDIDCILDSYKYGRLRINQALATKENVEKWIAAGIPMRWFKQVPNESNE